MRMLGAAQLAIERNQSQLQVKKIKGVPAIRTASSNTFTTLTNVNDEHSMYPLAPNILAVPLAP